MSRLIKITQRKTRGLAFILNVDFLIDGEAASVIETSDEERVALINNPFIFYSVYAESVIVSFE